MQPGKAGYHRLLSILSVLLDIVKKKIILKIRTKWNSVSVSVCVSQRIQNISIFSKPLSNETRNSTRLPASRSSSIGPEGHFLFFHPKVKAQETIFSSFLRGLGGGVGELFCCLVGWPV